MLASNHLGGNPNNSIRGAQRLYTIIKIAQWSLIKKFPYFSLLINMKLTYHSGKKISQYNIELRIINYY